MTQAEQECYIYDSLKAAMAKAGYGPLPTAHVVKSEAFGFILLEWIMKDGRFFFNVEVDPSESGWGAIRCNSDNKPLVIKWGGMDTFDADELVSIMWGPEPQREVAP